LVFLYFSKMVSQYLFNAIKSEKNNYREETGKDKLTVEKETESRSPSPMARTSVRFSSKAKEKIAEETESTKEEKEMAAKTEEGTMQVKAEEKTPVKKSPPAKKSSPAAGAGVVAEEKQKAQSVTSTSPRQQQQQQQIVEPVIEVSPAKVLRTPRSSPRRPSATPSTASSSKQHLQQPQQELEQQQQQEQEQQQKEDELKEEKREEQLGDVVITAEKSPSKSATAVDVEFVPEEPKKSELPDDIEVEEEVKLSPVTETKKEEEAVDPAYFDPKGKSVTSGRNITGWL